MSTVSKKRKPQAQGQGTRKKKKMQMLLTPRKPVDGLNTDDSTLPLEVSGVVSGVGDDPEVPNTTVGDVTLTNMENGYSDDSLTDLDEEEELGFKETDPMRTDMPINYERWEDEEVDALMVALNINREAVKFHFHGPGGGRDIKRQGWRDVAAYVNDTEDTHRTVRQCRNKADDYTQRVKGKFNKLRYEITRTGKGKVSSKYELKDIEMKALDYLKEEAVKGIPGIEVMSLPEDKTRKKASAGNRKLLWNPKREQKQDYSKVQMKREGVPKNYKDKNKRRVAREARLKNKKENAAYQKGERKKERKLAKEHAMERKIDKEKEDRQKKKDQRRARKQERAARRERKRQRADVRQHRKDGRKKRAAALKKEGKEGKGTRGEKKKRQMKEAKRAEKKKNTSKV